MNQHIEVIVTKLRTRYRAECPMFPTCKGVGATEEKALIDLSHSISRAISKMTQKNLASLFGSSQYTELILDARESRQHQRRVFPLSPDLLKAAPSQFILKYKNDPPPAFPASNLTDAKRRDIGDLLSSLEEMLVDNELGLQALDDFAATLQDPNGGPLQEEGLIFGFPLSMN